MTDFVQSTNVVVQLSTVRLAQSFLFELVEEITQLEEVWTILLDMIKLNVHLEPFVSMEFLCTVRKEDLGVNMDSSTARALVIFSFRLF